mmetsp:Transcript_51412/g.161598  ORF Transcript_51412/g.161598 Transcript_51412/m.161598 type:complete len:1046 (+) Transcript_51412:165-3302(+)
MSYGGQGYGGNGPWAGHNGSYAAVAFCPQQACLPPGAAGYPAHGMGYMMHPGAPAAYGQSQGYGSANGGYGACMGYGAPMPPCAGYGAPPAYPGSCASHATRQGFGKQARRQDSPSRAAAGGARQSSRPRDRLRVSGCQNETVAGIICGDFLRTAENHAKPVYRRDAQVNGLDVMLYFWDERDGPSFCGWWFGPKIGGDQVWAYHPSRTATTPPKSGWKVPYDGPVDPTLVVSARTAQAGQAAATQQAPAGYAQQQQAQAQAAMYGQQQQQAWAAQAAQQQQQAALTPQQQQYNLAMQQQEEMRKRQQLENIKKLEEMRRLQQLQQQELQRRQLEENRRKLEAANQQRLEEQRKRMEDVKRLQVEQRAILSIRRVIQKMLNTTPDQFEEHAKELAEVKEKELEACGSQKERMQQEVEQALEQAKQRVEQIKEQLKKVEESLKDFEKLVAAAEDAAKTLDEEAAPFSGDKELELDEVQATAKAVDDAGQEAKEKMKACTDFILAKGQEMKTPELPGQPPSESKQTLAKLLQRINGCTRGTEAALATCRESREKAIKRAEARKKKAKMEALFDKYDADKDGALSRNEVKKYARGEFDFALQNTAVDTLWKVLAEDGGKGVKKESFQRLKYAIGIARERVKDAERKAAREAREKELAKLRAELQERIQEAGKEVDAAGELVDKAEEQATPLAGKGKTMVSAEMIKLADEVSEAIKEAKEASVRAKKEVTDLADGVDADLQGWLALEMKALEDRMAKFEPRLVRASSYAARFREDAKIKESDERYALEKQALEMIKNHRRVNKLSSEAMFADVDTGKDGKIDESEFLAFFGRCEQLPKTEKPKAEKEEDDKAKEDNHDEAQELTEEELAKVFASLADEGDDAISKDRFLNAIRVFMKVSKDTVITTSMSIKDGRTLRRLELGEVVEVLEGPTKEETVDVLRVKAKVMKDDIEGWITLSGNQGTVFLEEGGNLFKVVKDTILTECFELDGGGAKDTTRKLKAGEVVEVREWARKEEKSGLMRMKCKVKSDGMTGWVTTVGNQGTVYMEVM